MKSIQIWSVFAVVLSCIPLAECLAQIVVEDADATWALIRDKREDGALDVFLRHPEAMPCSDCDCLPADEIADDTNEGYGISPTAYGLMPHYLRQYVRDEGTLSLEEGIQRITSNPGRKFLGLSDRGVLERGAFADIVVFDLDSLKEGDDFFKPNTPPEGIRCVLVNGTVVYQNRSHAGARAGKVLRKS